MRHIAIIGGGASGIAAAIAAAEAGAQVSLFEAGKRIGHSILVSGNGRCNWSNSKVQPADYANEGFVARAFEACPPTRVWEFFERLGLVSAEESAGRRYPQANKASSVLDVLRFRLEELGVEIACEHAAGVLRSQGGGWSVRFKDGHTGRFDAVLVACGGKVDSGLLPEDCSFVERRPRLCPIRTDRDSVKGLDNIRVKGSATLMREGSPLAQERGEIQFRQFGISGIAIFDLSRFAREGDAIELDFLPAIPEDALAGDVAQRAKRFPQRSAEQLLAGAVLPAIARAALRQAGIDSDSALAASNAPVLAHALKRYALQVRGFEEKSAQVNQGGLAVDELNPETMEHRAHPGLYVMGEALDVDGPCGGYNLHWAWTCGLLAGAAAARD